MAGTSNIEWTDATWNPVVGCTIVTAGCTNCYAMRMAARIETMHEGTHYAGTTKKVNGNPVWTGKLALAPEKILTAPLRWKKPRRIFVNSMGDLFHEDAPDEWIDRCFAVMALSPQHQFQVLTKRPERMRDYCSDEQTPFRIARAIDAISSVLNLGPEEIRPIAEYPGYFASSHGHIYSDKRGKRRKMKPDAGDEGHQRVQLHREASGDRGDRLLVHRIILETFVGPAPAADTQGRHGDGRPENNAVTNLRWGDQEANWSDSRRHGTHRRYSKLSPEQAADIRNRHAAGETGEALAREFDVSATQIRNIASGAQWATQSPIEWPLKQCWLGVSAERQKEADERIPILLQTPAAIRFVSLEPLLGPINLMWGWFPQNVEDEIEGRVKTAGLNWIIVGGESGPNARPMHPDWARAIRDKCKAAGASFLLKQWGAFAPRDAARIYEHTERIDFTDGVCMLRVGKKAAGRLLDGRTWDEFPEARS